MMTTERSTKTRLLATFEVGGALFAMDAEGVQEVVRLGPLTPVSHSAGEVKGILNLRGKIVTILDLGQRLGLGAAARNGASRVFIVEHQGEFVGLLVDKAGDVVEIGHDGLEPAPANVSRAQGRFIRGVARSCEQVITVVDTDLLAGDLGE